MVNLRKLNYRMKKKDLSLVYALQEYARVNGKNEPAIKDNRCFTFNDIKAAFNAGRESVIENASKLEWKETGRYEDCGIYLNVCKADKPLDNFSIGKWTTDNDIELLRNEFAIRGGFKNIEEAKSYAVKVYGEKIKQVLGL